VIQPLCVTCYAPTRSPVPDRLLEAIRAAGGVGNRITAAEMVNGVFNTLAWTYDAANRPTSETRRDVVTSVIDSRSYTYDAVGNRMSQQVNGLATLYSYNPLDQLLTSTPATSTAATFTYDGRGNRLSATSGIDTTTFSYDGSVKKLGSPSTLVQWGAIIPRLHEE
jgi:YD repeat-containing protein